MQTTGKDADGDRKASSSATRAAGARHRAAGAGDPSSEDWAFYIGLGAVAAAGFIDWPVAVVIAAGHLLKSRARNQAVEEILEGIEAGV